MIVQIFVQTNSSFISSYFRGNYLLLCSFTCLVDVLLYFTFLFLSFLIVLVFVLVWKPLHCPLLCISFSAGNWHSKASQNTFLAVFRHIFCFSTFYHIFIFKSFLSEKKKKCVLSDSLKLVDTQTLVKIHNSPPLNFCYLTLIYDWGSTYIFVVLKLHNR